MRFNRFLFGGASAALAAALMLTPVAVLANDKKAAPMTGDTAHIELPPGDDILPDRRHAEAVDRNCLSCHSTETILNQPALSRDVWKTEIDKMRTAYGAQIDPEADDDILAYLTAINGVRRDRWR
jgi:hypothetical protein